MTSVLAGLSVPVAKATKASDDYLKGKHNQLTQFDSIEDLVLDETRITDKDRRAIEHHVVKLRSTIVRTLWSNEIYVGRSLIDDFVLNAAKTGAGNVPARVIAELAAAGAERPGFVLYPLTRFGMEMPMIMERNSSLRDHAIFPKAGFAVCAQTHSAETAFEKLKEMARALGIRQKIDWWDIRHFALSAGWFGKNPLMLVRLVSYTGDTYENQFIYTLKIRIAASTILMLHSLAVEGNGLVDRFHSSSSVNNFETLDVRHYLIGEALPGRGRPISTRRVPMNVAPLDLARLSDIAATLSTNELMTSRMKRFEAAITAALRVVERGYFLHVNLATKSKAENRLYRRLITALDWFRQSFGSRTNESEAVVALAVAFETLLTDHYGPGVADRIQRRVGICLKSVPGVVAYKDSVVAIYHARSEIVHSGELGQATNIVRAQVAFVRCFCAVAKRLATWLPTSNEPMRDLLGDT
ncbi:HEPN domain-containing protein [Belnapia rosea]|uniref:HEPN domain-containing protein n=1 Tax=Belnapia rosea TaxID=938405 RepID=UPI00088AA116|nr:HEPN domain-containing protein [Belnapia rosea]SDB48491.1 hypothetical protein SAMN02927895_01838 [Belnapia rosea]